MALLVLIMLVLRRTVFDAYYDSKECPIITGVKSSLCVPINIVRSLCLKTRHYPLSIYTVNSSYVMLYIIMLCVYKLQDNANRLYVISFQLHVVSNIFRYSIERMPDAFGGKFLLIFFLFHAKYFVLVKLEKGCFFFK